MATSDCGGGVGYEDGMKLKTLRTITYILGIFMTSAASAAPERQISFASSKDGVELHGTFAAPKKIKGAILMIVGSGKADRDETVPAKMTYSGKIEKLFAQLSEAAVSAGYATLRYDKRGVKDENGSVELSVWKTADRDHLISDAVDAAKRLSSEAKIPVGDIVILGHSEGTIISVETALALGGKVKALTLFGAQARSMKDMLHFQIVEANLKPDANAEDRKKLEDEFQGALKFISESKEDFAPDGKPTNWYRQFLAAPANRERAPLVKAKFAFFQGGADRQTPPGEIDSFVQAGLKNPTILRYPNLGHGFSPEKNGKPTLGPVDTQVREDFRKYLRSL